MSRCPRLCRAALRLAGAVVVASMCLGSAQAELGTVFFEGVISPLGSFVDPTGSFSKGQAISGFWTVDTATPDGDADPKRGEYPQTGAPAFQIDIGGKSFSTVDATIQILDDYTTGIGTIDAYDVLGGSGASSIVGLTVDQMQITLRDTELPLNALASDVLPTGAPNPGSFDQVGQAAGQITGSFNGNDVFLNLEIRSARYVPEPSTALLALVGAGLLAISRRRRA
ncbi:MAG: PEP-CTERM sorting domain-containing protein [Pirellulales bacterium]